jgi:hypothetical protein
MTFTWVIERHPDFPTLNLALITQRVPPTWAAMNNRNFVVAGNAPIGQAFNITVFVTDTEGREYDPTTVRINIRSLF